MNLPMRKVVGGGVSGWILIKVKIFTDYVHNVGGIDSVDWYLVASTAVMFALDGLIAIGFLKTPAKADSQQWPIEPIDQVVKYPAPDYRSLDDTYADEGYFDSGYAFSPRSESILSTVHPDLQKVARRALQISAYDFAAISGARTLEQQRVLVDTGKSETMNSAHVKEPARAVDIMAYVDGKGTWQVEPYYAHIRAAFEQAGKELGVPMRGIITLKAGPDAGHMELSPLAYQDVVLA